MQENDRTIHRDTDEARGGQTSGVMRWVLGVSLAAAIIALSAIWIFGAATQGGEEGQADVTASPAETSNSEPTDSIVVPVDSAPPAGE